MGNRQNLTDNEVFNPLFNTKFRLRNQPSQIMAGTVTLDEDCPPVQLFDLNGAGRTLNLPLETASKFLFLLVINVTGTAQTLTIKDNASATTIISLAQNKIGLLWCDGTLWRGSPLP